MKQKPPIRILVPGRVYRNDWDATHTPMFHQVEGLVIEKGTHMGHLKGCLIDFVRAFFEVDSVEARFRPHFFPFTEPSVEFDFSCTLCGDDGQASSSCRVCKGTGWIEIGGAGMVDPAVFESVGYDPEEYTGFAFGLGIERMAMIRHGIDDIRLFLENDLRFTRQF